MRISRIGLDASRIIPQKLISNSVRFVIGGQAGFAELVGQVKLISKPVRSLLHP